MPAKMKFEASHGSRENYMAEVFGLHDDRKHWSRMKDSAIQLCQQELPPKKLPEKAKEKLGLTEEDCKKIQYSGNAQMTKNYVWEYLTVPWRKKYDYDMRYLQKRYPDTPVKDIICSWFSRLNSQDNFKDLARQYPEGRDIHRLYKELASKEQIEGGSHDKTVAGISACRAYCRTTQS